MSRFSIEIPLVTLSVWLAACAAPCQNRVISELTSPNASKRAVVFERSCGATTGFSTHVSVLNTSDALPKSAGNIFVADNNHGAAKDMTVPVRWAAPDQLVIRHSAQARVFRKELTTNGVAVVYEALP